MAEMLLAVVLLCRIAEGDDTGSEAFGPGLPDIWHRCWKLFSVVVANRLAFVLAMQVPVPSLANRWMYRQLTALDIEAARVVGGNLVIFGRDMVIRTSKVCGCSQQSG